jgi:phage terminase small subunit
MIETATESQVATHNVQPIAKPRKPGDKPKERKLTPKQKRFAEAYTDITNKQTFGNGTQSVLIAYNTESTDTAKRLAHDLTTKPNVLNYIEELNAKHGNSIEERSKVLAMCAQGTMQSETITRQIDGDGNVTAETRNVKGISPAQILKAIDLSNKVEGIYNRAQVAEHIARREYDKRMQELRDSLQKRVQATRRANTRQEAVACSGDTI